MKRNIKLYTLSTLICISAGLWSIHYNHRNFLARQMFTKHSIRKVKSGITMNLRGERSCHTTMMRLSNDLEKNWSFNESTTRLKLKQRKIVHLLTKKKFWLDCNLIPTNAQKETLNDQCPIENYTEQQSVDRGFFLLIDPLFFVINFCQKAVEN